VIHVWQYYRETILILLNYMQNLGINTCKYQPLPKNSMAVVSPIAGGHIRLNR
jgi:hypothetical protein